MTVFKYYMGFQTSDSMGYSTKLSLSKGSSKRDPIAGIVLVKVSFNEWGNSGGSCQIKHIVKCDIK